MDQETHKPVLLKETIQYFNPQLGQNFIDATVGNGGHARVILEKIGIAGHLIAIDRDADSIARAEQNLGDFKNQALFIKDSFGNLKEIVKESRIQPIHGILFDFGMSSSQLEQSGRGFSFLRDEPLDMRYDKDQALTAAEVVNSYGERELAEIFRNWGEEEKASLIAQAIVQTRKKKRIISTQDLVDIIERLKKRKGRLHPATKIFQALRIEVNQELEEIEKALESILEILALGGKAVFISFHSLEDRLIKNWARHEKNVGRLKVLTKKPVSPLFEEIKINPRSRSAKLRAIEKI